jgi:alpha-glucoside transport system substrate-binding protein
MNFTGTRDLTAVLTTRIQAGNPPDIAILPNPGLMNQFATAGNLKPLNPMLDMNIINQQYPSSWINLGTVNNNLCALFIKAANKSMIWFDPKVFLANGWAIPQTYDELIALSNTIVSAGKIPANPWSVGVESGQASGWPATDWMAQYFLSKYGGDAYDQWVNHQIPWTDPRIKDAWNSFGTIVNTPNYVPGGAIAVAATNFQNASYLPFQSPAKAAMYYEGDFTEGFITTQFPTLKAEQDFNYFPFPPVSTSTSPTPAASPSPGASASPTGSPVPTGSQASGSAVFMPGPVTGGADLVCAFKDTPAVRSFISYLATPEAQDIWVKRGGFVSVNKQIAILDYPDPIIQKSVQQLINSSTFRFGAGDSMPGAMQTAWWAGVLQYLQNPGQLDSILANLETAAITAYSASPTTSPSASPSPSPSASPIATSTP